MKKKLIEIFKVGKHISSDGSKIEFTEKDLKNIANNYNPRVHEAPVVVGHPKDNSPAFGWIQKLIYDPLKQRLLALPAQLNHNFVEAVQSGAYKKVSASLYAPDSANNPSPGQYSLRHVGFLGAQPPAIKGLTPVSFAEDEKTINIELKFSEAELAHNDQAIAQTLRRVKNFLIDKFSRAEADEVIPEWEINGITQAAANSIQEAEQKAVDAAPEPLEPETAQEVVAEVQAENEVLESQNEVLEDELTEEKKKRIEAEQKLAELEAEKLEAENTEFCEARIKEGRILPNQKKAVVQFMNSLSPKTLDFGEGQTTDQKAFFKKFLLSQPKVINFNEVSKGRSEVVDLNDPHVLAQKAREYQDTQASKGKSISFSEAVTTVKNF